MLQWFKRVVNRKGIKWKNDKETNIKSPRTFQEQPPWKEKAETSRLKITFDITYHKVFQNIRNILQELRLLLAPDKEHNKVFPTVPVAGFRNGKSLKDYLVRAVLPKINETGRCEPCEKET